MPVPFPSLPIEAVAPIMRAGDNLVYSVPYTDPDPVPVSQEQPITREAIDETLIVEWKSKKIDLKRKVAIFEGGVKATYGPTVLTADRLEVDMENKTGRADGNVLVVDPEGTLSGTNLNFDWKKRTGSAEDVYVQVGPMKARAKRIDIEPDRWILTSISLTPSRTRPPEFSIKSPRVVLRVGRSGRLQNPTFEVFGIRLLTIPTTLGFSLDRRVTGFRFPAISFRRGAGFGLAWNSSVLVNDQTSFAAQWNAFPSALPTYAGELAWSAVPPTKSTGLISPRTELGERFGDAYMDSVSTTTTQAEDDYLRDPRRTIAAGTYWNQSVRGRREDFSSISKRWELSSDFGGTFGPVGGYVQFRYQSIRPDRNSPFVDRLSAHGAANIGSWSLIPGLDFRLRGDLAAYTSGKQTYGWARGQAALVYHPIKQLQVAGALVLGGSAGNPFFGFDPLYSNSGVHIRADVDLGSIRASFLGKYDFGQARWYDHEYGFSFAAGSFEPYVVWRQFPNDVRFGFRIRAIEVFEKLQQRQLKRKSPK
ncbi:MAG: hypothetical protein K1X67_07610 [Fimbriimonadaceae bacterium]|nr:hypothetical protein [Fimbriimonadaceae bacterium]